MKLRSKDLQRLSLTVGKQVIESLASNPLIRPALEAAAQQLVKQEPAEGALVLDLDSQTDNDVLYKNIEKEIQQALIQVLPTIEPYAATKPRELNGSHLDETGEPLHFTLDGDEPDKVHRSRQSVVIHNSGDNPTFNVFSQSRKKDKMQTIEDNLMRLANEGIQFDRLTTYQVQVPHLGETWNFYLTSEKFHRTGLPSEGKGIDNFIGLLKNNNGKERLQ